MTIKYHKDFKKHFTKRIKPYPKLVKKFEQRLQLLLKDPDNEQLRVHTLTGEMSTYSAFSVNGDIRVIFRIVNKEYWLYDIGSYNQVY